AGHVGRLRTEQQRRVIDVDPPGRIAELRGRVRYERAVRIAGLGRDRLVLADRGTGDIAGLGLEVDADRRRERDRIVAAGGEQERSESEQYLHRGSDAQAASNVQLAPAREKSRQTTGNSAGALRSAGTAPRIAPRSSRRVTMS